MPRKSLADSGAVTDQVGADMTSLTCSVDECDRRATNVGMCSMHRRRLLKTGTTEAPVRRSSIGDECAADGCLLLLSPPYGRGLCSLHYKRMAKFGTTEPPKRVLLKDTICTIPDCFAAHSTARLCKTHYSRLMKTGSATTRKFGQVVDGKRVCSVCKVDTPLDLMSRSAASYCRTCVNAKARARPRVLKVLGRKPCENCGQEFAFNNKKNRHCSTGCASATVNKRNWKHLQARRARMKGAFVESFHAKEIYERDDWRCGICDTQIDPAAKLPNQMSASIDHIIPISKGGTHERANVQAAHLLCNVSKGAKVA